MEVSGSHAATGTLGYPAPARTADSPSGQTPAAHGHGPSGHDPTRTAGGMLSRRCSRSDASADDTPERAAQPEGERTREDLGGEAKPMEGQGASSLETAAVTTDSSVEQGPGGGRSEVEDPGTARWKRTPGRGRKPSPSQTGRLGGRWKEREHATERSHRAWCPGREGLHEVTRQRALVAGMEGSPEPSRPVHGPGQLRLVPRITDVPTSSRTGADPDPPAPRGRIHHPAPSGDRMTPAPGTAPGTGGASRPARAGRGR